MKKRKSLAPGALMAPIPPAIVTVGNMEKANMLTVAWTGILATHPPRTYVSVRPERYSHGILKAGGEFVINLPSAKMARTVDFVGIYTGGKIDKFERTGLTKIESEKVQPPTVGECPIALECRVCEVLPMGTHDVFIADILSVSCREDIMDGDGRLLYEKADLLAYAHGEYYALGEKLGKFGFSTDKGKKKERTDKKPEIAKESKPSVSKDSKKESPFYKGMPKGKSKKKSDPDKGKPHGKGGRAK